MSAKLLPCPFCGELERLHVDHTNSIDYAVWCDNPDCYVCGPNAKTQRKAINLWNKRVVKEE